VVAEHLSQVRPAQLKKEPIVGLFCASKIWVTASAAAT
jgi:hypothetical protein